MRIDYKSVLDRAEFYKPAMSRFLRDMIAIPSESCQEKEVIQRIEKEMLSVGFDKVDIDPMGNIIGTIGSGKHLIAYDAHIDTVGVGNVENWEYDPYQGFENDEIIIGRGASDQEGGMAAMVYAGKIIKDLGLEKDYTLLMTGTVQEEDCDGLCWQYLIEEGHIRPEFVVSTEPTSCRIHRGQRGRMEIKVAVSGLSAHGSAPERGDNAIFKMAPILAELQELHGKLKHGLQSHDDRGEKDRLSGALPAAEASPGRPVRGYRGRLHRRRCLQRVPGPETTRVYRRHPADLLGPVGHIGRPPPGLQNRTIRQHSHTDGGRFHMRGCPP